MIQNIETDHISLALTNTNVTLTDIVFVSKYLSFLLSNKFLTVELEAILGSVIRQPTKSNFFMAISEAIEINPDMYVKQIKAGYMKVWFSKPRLTVLSFSDNRGVSVKSSAPNKGDGKQACLQNLTNISGFTFRRSKLEQKIIQPYYESFQCCATLYTITMKVRARKWLHEGDNTLIT